MAPYHSYNQTHTLARRDATLSAGAIAGIIVGIVIVSLILLGLFIWRLLYYRQTLGPYGARSRDASAFGKARSQMRGGEHVRSTRPRDQSMMGVGNNYKGKETADREEHGEVEERGSQYIEDQRSLNGTVHDQQEEDEAATGRRAEKVNQQERDYEIFQGHQDGYDHGANSSQAAMVDASQGEKPGKKGSIRQGCTTM